MAGEDINAKDSLGGGGSDREEIQEGGDFEIVHGDYGQLVWLGWTGGEANTRKQIAEARILKELRETIENYQLNSMSCTSLGALISGSTGKVTVDMYEWEYS